MPDKRHFHKNTLAYPLNFNGAFTWNRKTRRLCFMRAGDPQADREEMREARGFIVEGDDIKTLYQVLHEHYMTPKNLSRSWNPELPVPPNNFSERRKVTGQKDDT